MSITYGQKLSKQKFLIYSLIAIAFGILIANLIGEDAAIQFGNWVYIPVLVALLALSIIITARNKIKGSHGIAWLLFTIGIVLWFTAEMIWTANELIYEVDTYPSEADFFWLAGYPFYFAFLIFYLRPVKKAISQKIVITSTVIAIALLAPMLYVVYYEEMDFGDIETILEITYPVADALVMIPALIGVILFFRGQVNFLWALMCIGFFCDIVADSGFLFLELDDSYYSGHPIEILYVWSYLLFAFGVYDHVKLFKKRKN